MPSSRSPRPGRGTPSPSAAELRQLYVVDDLSMAALTARYRVSKRRVRAWLIEGGIAIRIKREAGRRRQLSPPPAAELRRLYVGLRLSAAEIAERIGVSDGTVLGWLAEAAIERRHSALKGRRRGERVELARPTAATLKDLYLDQHRSMADIAAEMGVTVHLVRTWMHDDGIAARPAGGFGRRRTPVPRRHQLPPEDELHHLRVAEHWSLPELAERYRVHPQTVNRWLSDYDIVSDRRGRRRLPGVSVAELVDRYGRSQLTVTELARQVGLTHDRVAAELRAAGVGIDRSRPRRPPLGLDDRNWAVQRYTVDEWPMTRIAEGLGRSVRSVRAELVAAGIVIVRRSGASRHDRAEAPPNRVERLYVADQLTAEQTGETLGLAGAIVLRTGHSYGLPIRPGGLPLVPAEVRLIEDLYADETVAAILDRHRIPRRPPIGGIAARFPVPIALSPDLIRGLYVDAGCSSIDIELVTGQASATVRVHMAHYGIALRSRGTRAPFRARVRAARRQAWLGEVVERYRETGSTRRLAREYGCSQNTIRRWLCEAGVELPGRGHWKRGSQRWTPPEHELWLEPAASHR